MFGLEFVRKEKKITKIENLNLKLYFDTTEYILDMVYRAKDQSTRLQL